MDEMAFSKPSGSLVQNNENNITFLPNFLPPKIQYDESLITLVTEASTELGHLSGIGALLHNPELIIRPYLLREAVLSSKIEGTQASMRDMFRFQAGATDSKITHEEKRISEIINYVKAVRHCLKEVKNGKQIDLDLVKVAHKKLLKDVRGQELEPGIIRSMQNWIGPEGTKIEEATYVPPPPENVDELLIDEINFIQHPPERMPVLIQCAIMHYQFEAIHPFADGNGRIGRLLIPLLLFDRGILNQPLLYLSGYIEKNKTQYYNLLLQVSQKGKWIDWIKFFLYAVITQARDASNNIEKLEKLRAQYHEKLKSKKASASVYNLTDYLFSNPIVTIPKAASYLEMTYPPAKKAIEVLVSLEILKAEDHKERNREFYAHEINAILS